MKRTAYISSFGATGIAIALSLITSILLARYLGPEGRGALLALTFWPTLLAGVFNLSVNEATTFHVARAISTQAAQAGNVYAASALWLQISISVGATICVLLAVPMLLPSSRGESLGMVLWFAALFTPLMILDLHFKAILQGRGAFVSLNLVRLCQPLIYAIALVSIVWMARLEVKTVMIAMVLSVAGSFAVGAVFSRQPLFKASIRAARETLRTGWKFHMANLLLFAGAETDKIIVLQLMDDRNIGYYAVAINLSAFGSRFIVQSLVLVLTREMAAVVTKGEQRAVLIRNANDAGLMLLLINGAAAALAPWWLPILYGSDFGPAVPITMVLLLMNTLKGLRQVVDRAMRATRNISVGMLAEAVGFAGLLIFGWAGVRIAGLQGLVWGIVAAQAVALLVIAIGAGRLLGFAPIDLSPFRKATVTRLVGVTMRELRAARAWWR